MRSIRSAVLCLSVISPRYANNIRKYKHKQYKHYIITLEFSIIKIKSGKREENIGKLVNNIILNMFEALSCLPIGRLVANRLT